MKKLFTFLVCLLFSYGFSQKTVYIFNDSHYSVNIADITTLPNNGTGYPQFSKAAPNTITLLPISGGTSYILDNTSSATKFPFLSPGSSPQITSWGRVPGGGFGAIPTSPSTAYNGYGNGQKFNYIKFSVGTNGNLGQTSLYGPFDQHLTGNGWAADLSTNYNSGTLQETVIVIYDYP